MILVCQLPNTVTDRWVIWIFIVMNNNVLTFYVSMYNPILMYSCKCLNNVQSYTTSNALTKTSGFVIFIWACNSKFDCFRYITSITVFEQHIIVVIWLPLVKDANDVRMFEGRQCLDLSFNFIHVFFKFNLLAGKNVVTYNKFKNFRLETTSKLVFEA